MPAETMHNLAVSEAERLYAEDPGKWAKVPSEKLAAAAIANVKTRLKVRHAVAHAIDDLLAPPAAKEEDRDE